jgi:hypothetical protein
MPNHMLTELTFLSPKAFKFKYKYEIFLWFNSTDDRRRDGKTNFILRIKEQETRLILHENNDDDDDEL